MNSKKYIKIVLSMLLSLLIFTAFVNIIIDPLFQYHKPFFGMQPVVTDERYQNAGIAKNYDFDNAIIGNSMSENFRVSSVSRVFGGETVKLVASGSYPLDWTYTLKILSDRKETPKNILVNIDSHVLKASPIELLHEHPIFLYDKNIFNDVGYWFNFRIMLDYTLNMLKCNLANEIPDYDEAFMWTFNPEDHDIAKEHKIPDTSLPDEKVYFAKENIELLAKYIELMPNTRFTFFFSPFSIVAYDDMIRTGVFDEFENACLESCKMLLSYDNVCVIFRNDEAIKATICNLTLYRDINHYSKDVSENILCSIENKTGLLTKDNYESEISDFFDFVRNYDFDSIYK